MLSDDQLASAIDFAQKHLGYTRASEAIVQLAADNAFLQNQVEIARAEAAKWRHEAIECGAPDKPLFWESEPPTTSG